MFRNRDIFALLAVLVLVRTAWNNGVETISSAVDLAFFFPRQGVMVVSPMDVDGDGTQEALAVLKVIPKTENFKLQILDLKPLHHHRFQSKYLDPFQPNVIFSSEEINDENAHPIHLTTGQLLLEKRAGGGASIVQKYEIPENSEINDQTRKYFCGTDWHDASSKCKTPCPSGQASDCPGDERCYADTSCDILSHAQVEATKSGYELTPGGGLPSVVSMWGNGVVMLHSLTNGKSEQNSELGLQEMWRYRVFEEKTIDALWEEINVVFLDAYSSMEAKAEHGMIVVSASYYPHETPGKNRATLTIAIDALRGTKLWESHSDVGLDSDEKPLPLPMAKRGQTSFARRRSSVAKYMHGAQSSAAASALPNCMSLLRKAIKHEVFPYSYWGPQDAGIAAIHLNQKEKSSDRRNHQASKPHEQQQQRKLQEQQHQKKKWHHKLVHHRKKHRRFIDRPIQGKPNALVTQTRGGLQIRSLRNGKALCHLALLEENLYSDLNNDGVLDQIQVAMHSKTHKPDDKFVWQLAGRLHEEHAESKKEDESGHESGPLLCHLLGLSGIPAKEEMFSAPICGKVHERPKEDIVESLDSINPMVVESLGKRPDKHDIIVALNNGMIHRIQGTGGRRLWALSGTKHIDSFPTWESNTNHHALLSRIDAKKVPAPLRPLLLSGENALAVLSATTGHLLAHIAFPQKSTAKPLLADLSGDGSTDVVIQTKDGIWGYRVAIHHHFPVIQRILVGLMMMFLMLATIRNRYSKGGKRSTDI